MQRPAVFLAVLLLLLIWLRPGVAQQNAEPISPDNLSEMREVFFIRKTDRIINQQFSWSPDGRYFAVAGGGGARVYERDGSSIRLVQHFRRDSYRTVTFNQDGSLIAASDGVTPAVWIWSRAKAPEAEAAMIARADTVNFTVFMECS